MDYTILMLIVMVAIMYFLMIRPENKRKKKAQEMRDSLKKGDIITTIGGIIGKIVSVTKDTIVIETSDDRVRMELAKWAVSSVGVQNTEQPEEKKDEKKPAKKEEEKKEADGDKENWNPEI
ncbi:preprotein translocase subunit YajC [uncultured Oscillibacter sp.]|jgi:preprotein translocase subunit YajC|uniref:preprotein translocase subunit YajC n=1 Tax=uncultured Oscillibacter sp. TaxID=876091 RepID=UPI0021705C46|nr:preprotein translocase subunit YajC [uncultured Oscillibacter sp.]MCI9553874.1 preprotein translocase subunit YajC [Oscillibacter sp.]